MILGANTLQIPLIQEAQRMGFNTVVVSPNKEEPGFKYATYPIYADVKDQELLLKYAREYDIAGVITDQTDIPVRTAAYIAENMGLPGIGYETATLFTDKFLMREKCKELNIPTLKYKLVENIEEAIEFFDALEGDAILKPVDNQGSKGVSKINSKEVLIEKFQEAMDYSKSQSVLIEQYVTGREFVVEGLTYDYEFQNLICGDTHYFNIPDVFSATTRIFPSTADKDLVERVKDLNRKIVTGFGLKQGISHSEFIMDGDEIYLIETAARGGGVFISSDLISISTGLNTEKFLIEMATGTLKEVPEIKDTGKVCCYMAFFLPVGEVVSIEGVHKVKELSYTHRDNLDTIYMGLKTKPFVDKTARKFIIVSGDSHDELIENMKAIKDALQIKVKTDQGIEGPIWN